MSNIDTIVAKKIGARLRDWRLSSRLSSRELAEEIGCNYRTILGAERGRAFLGGNILAGLAMLGCDINVLITGMTADQLRARVQPFSRRIEVDRAT